MINIVTVVRMALVVVVLSLIHAGAHAININSKSTKGLAKAHGFLLGQEYSLSRIENELPELAGSVTIARAQFSAAFPDIRAKFDRELRQAFGEKEYKKYLAAMQSKIRELAAAQPISKEIATDFLQQVKNRAKGDIDPPILHYLLAVKYQNDPAGEISDGYFQLYHSDGSGKAKGLKLSLKLPLSWLGEENRRPNTLQMWTSEGGTGMEVINLLVRDLPEGPLTKSEVEEGVRSGEVKQFLPEGATYVASGNIQIENQPGFWIQARLDALRGEISIYQNIVHYNIFFKNKHIMLGCSAGGGADQKESADLKATQIRPLCQRVLSSLVLPQVYR